MNEYDTKTDITELCPTPGKASVESSLKQLADEGVLIKHGKGRATFYQRLRRYMGLTHVNGTTYFRHLIHGNRLKGRSNELHRAMHASRNKIYSDIQQIVRHQRAAERAADAAAQMRFLTDKPCEEVYLLASQK